MKIAEMIVQLGEEHDQALHMAAAPVNMRLFRSNPYYRMLILRIDDMMRRMMKMKYEDYAAVRGISGANIGVPLNIVVINTKEDPKTFLNPKVVSASDEMRTAKSNCGSLNLPKSIAVKRHEWVEVEYYDCAGDKHTETFTMGEGTVPSGTLQHEIDHNLGILITDR